MNAREQLLEMLRPGEQLLYVVFGIWEDAPWNDDAPHHVPSELIGVLLPWEKAEQYMVGWKFDPRYGAAGCYPIRAWTNKRVIVTVVYDGSVWLDSVPRDPTGGEVNFFGGE